jgi:hypothetical protein
VCVNPLGICAFFSTMFFPLGFSEWSF